MALSAVELMKWVGKSAEYQVANGMYARVKILDAKTAWGSIRVLITPADGRGSVWVETSSITLVETFTRGDWTGYFAVQS